MPVLRALLVGLLALCLSGCIESETGIRYRSQTQGEIVQHLRLSDRLDPTDPTAQQWLQVLEQRSRSLGGRAVRSSPQELQVTIPFHDGEDLTSKFNAFFNSAIADADEDGSPQEDSLGWPRLTSSLQVSERNWLVVQQNRLLLDLDLRSLGVRSPTGTVIARPGNLLNLEFHLTTPWGAESAGSQPPPQLQDEGRELVWRLQPGATHHLEATFLVPSLLGAGAGAIALLVAVGTLLRSFLFANPDRAR